MNETRWRESGRNFSGKAALVLGAGVLAGGSLYVHDKLASGTISKTQALAHQGLTLEEFKNLGQLPEPLRRAGVYLEYTPAACNQEGKCTDEKLPDIPRAQKELNASVELAQGTHDLKLVTQIEEISEVLETPLQPNVPITVETHSGARFAIETLASSTELKTQEISERVELIQASSKNTSGRGSLAVAVVTAGFFGAVLGRVTKRTKPNIGVEISQ